MHGKTLAFGVLILAAVTILSVGTTVASTLRVPSEFSTIGAALNAARAGDHVEVEPGIYRETDTRRDGVPSNTP